MPDAALEFTVPTPLVLMLRPRSQEMLARLLRAGARHRWLREIDEALADPRHPEARGLAIIVAVLTPLSLLSSWLLSSWLSGLDLFVYQSLQELRSPLADLALVFITGFGDSPILLATLGAGA